MLKSYQIVFLSVVGIFGLVIKYFETFLLPSLVRAYTDVLKHHDKTTFWRQKGLIYLILADNSPLLSEIMAGAETWRQKLKHC